MVIQQNSRKLLMMDILMSETCWTHKKWNKIASDIKLVFYSSTITMMRGPINISEINYQEKCASCWTLSHMGIWIHVSENVKVDKWHADVDVHISIRGIFSARTDIVKCPESITSIWVDHLAEEVCMWCLCDVQYNVCAWQRTYI